MSALSSAAADLAAFGVDEMVPVAAPPDRPEAAGRWVTDLAGRWLR